MTFDTKSKAAGSSPQAEALTDPTLLRPSAPVSLAAPAGGQVAAPGRAAVSMPGSSPQASAAQLHALVEQGATRESTTGTPATLLLGVEAAADLRLGSTRQLVTEKSVWDGPRYAALDHPEKLGALLEQLRHSGQLEATLAAYQHQYGKSFSAVLGEEVRDPNLREPLLKLLPPPIEEAQLTQDAFLEQLAVGMVYLNDGAEELQNLSLDTRRQSNPKALLDTFGFRAGPPISGKWGFQMRVFYPVQGKARWPNPLVVFRGTEGIQFDPSGQKAAGQKASAGQPLDPNRVGQAIEGTQDTLIGDFSPAGVGYNQYEQNAELIEHSVTQAHEHGQLYMVGHSLGGALAQLAAARFPALTTRCVTFQSPGIDQADVNRVKQYNAAHLKDQLQSRHYRIDGDTVPTAGEADLPGQINYFDRATRPKGSHGPLQADELSYDTINVPRASAGHVSPMLSTYIHGQTPKTGPLQALDQYGLHDEGSLGPKGQDVQAVYGGQYSTEHDPRINKEGFRRSKVAWALEKSGLFEETYDQNIAYNTALEKVEQLAAGKQYKSYDEFREAVLHFLQSSEKLPLSQRDLKMGKQLKLPASQTDYSHPIFAGEMPAYPQEASAFARMQAEGVQITPSVKRTVARELPQIWQSWHPDEQGGR